MNTKTVAALVLSAALVAVSPAPDAAACRPAADHPEKCEEVHEGWDNFGSDSEPTEPVDQGQHSEPTRPHPTDAPQAPAPTAQPGTLAVTG